MCVACYTGCIIHLPLENGDVIACITCRSSKSVERCSDVLSALLMVSFVVLLKTCTDNVGGLMIVM